MNVVGPGFNKGNKYQQIDLSKPESTATMGTSAELLSKPE